MAQAMKTDLWLSKFSHSLGPIAQYYVAMGENGRAIDWLEQSFFRHEAGLVWAATRPEYDGLRAEPRFTALLQKMGLAP